MSIETKARHQLHHTWHAFFGRFGRLTGAQAAAIEPILDGRSVVLCAPTASGKTEALLAPMLERSLAETHSSQSLDIAVICPTRALCNDFFRRVEPPIRACGQTVELKTGDSPGMSTEPPPKVLVTTPESLDSMLSRCPTVLGQLEAVFLDELHLLDGGARGDHLRALVSRIRSFRPALQVCAASATAADSARLAAEFAGPAAEVLEVTGPRDRAIEARMAEALTLEQAASEVRRLMDAEPGCKLLVFANSRAEVEEMAACLADRHAFTHHGSLSKGERLRTERRFLNAPSGVCVATMTLELGIDIGDVDRTVLLNPPPNVASFVQRVGRSNRRGESSRALCLYSTDFDRRRFEHMLACARAGRLFPEAVCFRPTILPQQATSLIFQNPKGWVNAAALHARLPTGVQKIWSESDCAEILAEMRRDGFLYADSHGRYVADEPARDGHRYGSIHTHIDADSELEVVDEATGRTIGTANYSPEGRAHSTGLLLAGKNRRVTRVRDGRVFVENDDFDEDPSFLSRTGPRYSYSLARDLAGFLGHADDELRFVRVESAQRGPNEWAVRHFFGTLWSELLTACLRARGFTVPTTSHFFSTARRCTGRLPTSLGSADHIEGIVDDFLEQGYRRLVKKLQPGPWRRHVPDTMLRRWVTRCVRPAEFAEAAAGFRLVEADLCPQSPL